MKFFISYRPTGEDPSKLKIILEKLSDTLANLGHTSFIYSRDITNWEEKPEDVDLKSAMGLCFERLEDCDAVLALSTNNEFSEGMIMEIGYAISSGKNIYLATANGTNLPKTSALAYKTAKFSDFNDLNRAITKMLS